MLAWALGSLLTATSGGHCAAPWKGAEASDAVHPLFRSHRLRETFVCIEQTMRVRLSIQVQWCDARAAYSLHLNGDGNLMVQSLPADAMSRMPSTDGQTRLGITEMDADRSALAPCEERI
jgi:hypothetical protein